MVIDALHSDEPPDWKLLASAEYTRERNEVGALLRKIVEEQEKLQQKAKAYEARLAELDNGAKVFGFRLLDDQAQEKKEGNGSGEDMLEGGQLFKDAALQALKDVYPSPLKASQIRSKVEFAMGRKFHEKTAGMTLYRLSKEGAVRREGHRWFFVPVSNLQPSDQMQEWKPVDQMMSGEEGDV